jgi:hypothetical protein
MAILELIPNLRIRAPHAAQKQAQEKLAKLGLAAVPHGHWKTLIASIPVAMLAVFSITMALGALALSKEKAIVSRLSEALDVGIQNPRVTPASLPRHDRSRIPSRKRWRAIVWSRSSFAEELIYQGRQVFLN